MNIDARFQSKLKIIYESHVMSYAGRLQSVVEIEDSAETSGIGQLCSGTRDEDEFTCLFRKLEKVG